MRFSAAGADVQTVDDHHCREKMPAARLGLAVDQFHITRRVQPLLADTLRLAFEVRAAPKRSLELPVKLSDQRTPSRWSQPDSR